MLKQKFIRLTSNYTDNNSFIKDCWNEIETNYSSKSRHYHSLLHIEFMIRELNHVKNNIEKMDTILFSIYYHDIIYKSTKSNNENESALFFKKRIKNTNFKDINTVFEQIEATKHHKLSTNNDTNILLDLDLSVLGQSNEIYKKYSTNIRKEYKIYPDFMYNKGRIKVLKHLLSLDSIYKTEYFLTKYEVSAQSNLKNELDALCSK